MSRKLAEQQGPNVGSPTLRVELPLAASRRFAGQLAGPVRSIAADLGDRGVHLALALAACIGVLAILGAEAQEAANLPAFDLGGEVGLSPLAPADAPALDVPALFSAVLLYVASGYAFAAGRSQRFPWTPLAAFLAFMGTDELLMIHEHLDKSVAAWQILYLPLVAVGGLCWLVALGRMRKINSERLLWLGGAAFWISAQLIELVANGGGWATSIPLRTEMSGVEEILEMVGSSMFLLALYLLARRLPAQQPRLGGHHSRA
jgi:hypothetical protein